MLKPKPLLTIAEVKARMQKQLRESGLSHDQKGYTPLTAEQCPTGLAYKAAGYQITYHDQDGKPTPFFRFRYVEEIKGDFGTVKDVRYVQPTGVLPQVYWSTNAPWKKILADKEVPLFITEGEKKADCGGKYGLAVIGLGGVWSFKSKSRNLSLLKELAAIDWSGRRVYIVYDSDAVFNRNILMAETELARQLIERGANVYALRLTHDLDRKVGLDDFIVSDGVEAFNKLVDSDAEEFANSVALHEMNSEVTYINDPSAVLKLETNQIMDCRKFVNEAFANRKYTATVPAVNNGSKQVEKSTAKEWMKWGGRAVVERMTYKPGQPEITAENEWNRWKGWEVEPKEGGVKPWTELLDFLCKSAGPEARLWLEQWLAYPLQYPGAKLFSAPALWSYTQRMGKTLLGYTMKDIYGRSFREIGSDDLVGNFNPWAEDKQFIMGDEIATAEENRKTVYNRLKRWITQAEITINKKFQPVYTLPDCANYYFNSNSADMFYIAKEDARLMVIEVEGKPLPKTFYNNYFRWKDKQGGVAAILYHLLHHLDTKGFDPTGPPPVTQAKRSMQDVGLTPAEKYVSALKSEPTEMLTQMGIGPFKLYTINDLVEIARSHTDNAGQKYITTDSLGKALGRYGFKKVPTKDGTGRLKIPGRGFPYVWNFGATVDNPDQIRELYRMERVK